VGNLKGYPYIHIMKSSKGSYVFRNMDNFTKATPAEKTYAVPWERPIGGLNPLLVT